MGIESIPIFSIRYFFSISIGDTFFWYRYRSDTQYEKIAAVQSFLKNFRVNPIYFIRSVSQVTYAKHVYPLDDFGGYSFTVASSASPRCWCLFQPQIWTPFLLNFWSFLWTHDSYQYVSIPIYSFQKVYFTISCNFDALYSFQIF